MSRWLHGLAFGALSGWLLLAIGVFVYVGVSFWHARRHTPDRGLGASLRALASESVLAFVVTPLLLVYVAFGRRMAHGGGTPIVLVHGYTQNRGTFVAVARALRRAGLGPIYGFNYWSLQDVRKSALRLARFVGRVRRETGQRRVDVVAHSMGGLVTSECVSAVPGRFRRCVTIASPHGGVLWRGPVVGKGAAQLRAGSRFLAERRERVFGVPFLSIASTHDNVVFPAARSSVASRGGRDVVVRGPGHLGILFDRRVLGEIVAFLAHDGRNDETTGRRDDGTTE